MVTRAADDSDTVINDVSAWLIVNIYQTAIVSGTSESSVAFPPRPRAT